MYTKTFFDAIRRTDRQTRPRKSLMSTEEVSQTIEKDIEEYIAANPSLIGKGLRLVKRQEDIQVGRLDLLLENQREQVVVEVKYGRIGREALSQILRYVDELKRDSRKKVRGVIVCSEIMPAFEDDLRKQKKVTILRCGWDLKTEKWGEVSG